MSDFVVVEKRSVPAGEDVDTRERLVRAAIEVFLEKGYGGTRVQDIARRAGYTSGALYVHFPSRTALLGEAIIREGQTILGALTEQISESCDGPGQAASLLAAMTTGEPTRLDLLLLEALALASRSDEAKEVLGVALDGLVASIMVHVVAASSHGDIDPGLDPDAIRQVLLAWIFGGVASKSLRIATSTSDAVAATTSRLLSGLAPRSS